MGNYLMLIVINLAISFAVPNISVGGHIGGLIGGILCTLAFTKFGRGTRCIQPAEPDRSSHPGR
jgi:membrane associated rhomboid family serine protease